MNVNLTVSAALNNTANQFVLAAYSDPALTVLVEMHAPSKPYANPLQVTFTTLNANQMYYFVLWESPDGTASGTIRNSCNFQPTSQTVTLRGDLSLTADVSAGLASGGTGYVDPSNSLLGWTYTLYMEGYGPLTEGSSGDYTLDSENNWVLTGGNTVQPQQKFYMVFQPQMYSGAAPISPLITTAEVKTATVTLTAADKNKAIVIQGAAASLNLTLPAISTVSDFDRFEFHSCGGSHINASILCAGSDKIQRASQVTKIVLGQNETLKLFRLTISGTSYWIVDNDLQGLDMVGRIFESYTNSLVNAIPLDGSLISRTTYQRLWDLVQTFASGILISESNWANTNTAGQFTNKGFFSTGDGSTTFRVPDLRIYASRRTVDGVARLAGSFQTEMVGAHDHTTHGQGAITGAGHNWFLSKSGNRYSGGGSDSFGGSQTNPDTTMRTDFGNGTENRANNTGVYLMIRI